MTCLLQVCLAILSGELPLFKSHQKCKQALIIESEPLSGMSGVLGCALAFCPMLQALDSLLLFPSLKFEAQAMVQPMTS